ncbi:class II aldolase/adducin family protein [Ottowia thiooxydans]|uniref:class II aldolase/adducin family protein n=1 Tax=Ottowia thiooxydans TaxID=219182 RepID=UPI000418DB96|nr:class II aldolase/adducin family protein [Ottowia thiooxydans]
MRTSVVVRSKRSEVSPEEWDARVNLAAAYRLTAEYGMTDMIANHISVAVPGEPDHFLINPYGLLYTEITASNLVKINGNGDIISNSELDLGISRAGFRIHSTIHAARPEMACIMHTHTRAGMAVSALKCGLLQLTQTATRFDKIGYHRFGGSGFDENERTSLIENLGDAEVLILRNHGLLTLGETVPEAFNAMYRLELSCRAQIDAMSCNTDLNLLAPEVIALAQSQWKPQVTRRYGMLEWPALLRHLERIDPTYKD